MVLRDTDYRQVIDFKQVIVRSQTNHTLQFLLGSLLFLVVSFKITMMKTKFQFQLKMGFLSAKWPCLFYGKFFSELESQNLVV